MVPLNDDAHTPLFLILELQIEEVWILDILHLLLVLNLRTDFR